MKDKYIKKYESLGYSRNQAEEIVANFDKACEYIDAFIKIGCPIPVVEITKSVGFPQKLLDSECTENKTDLQEFEMFLNKQGIKYQIKPHAFDIKELEIYPEHLYHNYKNEVKNGVSIVFDKDDKIMYLEGMSW